MGDTIRTEHFGTLSDGRQATLFTLSGGNGLALKITDYGATAVSMLVPDGKGCIVDVIQGFEDVSGYEKTVLYQGATIGRYAGQINDGRFTLGGKTYTLYINDRGNSLHGGKLGFNKRLFDSRISETENSVIFSYLSPDGEEGYPGNLEVKVTYSLSPENEIIINHYAQSDADTVLNMTHHSYFNLDGYMSGSVLDHYLSIRAQQYTESAEDLSPNGIISSVDGTPMDFRIPCRIGERIGQDFEQLRISYGYDHNWVIEGWGEGIRPVCELVSTNSGIRLSAFSDLPGLQVYSGNFLDGTEAGKDGIRYEYRSAVCLEPQYYPNSLKHPAFPSPILLKDEIYNHTIKYKFDTGA